MLKPSEPQGDQAARTPVEASRVEPLPDVPDAVRGGTSARSVLELISLVVAPTALVTALAFFFGWTLTNARSRYFGIDPSALDFSTRDYVLRSSDALYVPLGAIIVVALGALGIHALVSALLRDPKSGRALWPLPWAIAAMGCALLGLGMAAALWSLPFDTYYLIPPLAPGLGAALLGYGLYLARRRLAPVAVALLASLIVLSAFWATAKYADALGRGRAKQLEQSLSTQPSVIVYSIHALGLRPPVITNRLERSTSEYAFRYEGLRLLVRSAGKYFLVPDNWKHDAGADSQNSGEGVAIVLPDTDDFRFEFRPGNR
jgi:hypothetical protein